MNTDSKRNGTEQCTISVVRRSAFIKWHRFLFFLQWIKFYKLHLINALKADLWAFQNGMSLSFKDRVDFYKWNSWNKYKAHHTYMYKKQKQLWLIDARHFDELVGQHCA